MALGQEMAWAYSADPRTALEQNNKTDPINHLVLLNKFFEPDALHVPDQTSQSKHWTKTINTVTNWQIRKDLELLIRQLGMWSVNHASVVANVSINDISATAWISDCLLQYASKMTGTEKSVHKTLHVFSRYQINRTCTRTIAHKIHT